MARQSINVVVIAMIVVNMLFVGTVCKFNKIVWTYWDRQIKDDQHYMKLFEYNHKKYINNTGWQLRHLNQKSIWNYLQPITKFQQLYQHQVWNQISSTSKNNIMRMAILNHYGGVYIDYTVILIDDLDWVNQLEQYWFIQNKYKSEAEVMMFYARHSSLDKYKDYIVLPTYEISFIACKPNNAIFTQTLHFIVDTYLKNYEKYDFDSQYSIFYDIAKKQGLKSGFDSKYFQIQIALMTVIGRKQAEFDKKWKQNTNEQRQLAVNYYNIWTAGAIKAGYSYYNFQMPRQFQPLVKINALKFKQKLNGNMPVFIKLWRGVSGQLKKFLQVQNPKPGDCKDNTYMLESSIVYEYLVKDYPVPFNNNIILNDQEYTDLCVNISPYSSKLVQIQERRLKKSIKKLDEKLQKINIKLKSLQNIQNKQFIQFQNQLRQGQKQQNKQQNIFQEIKQTPSIQYQSPELSKQIKNKLRYQIKIGSITIQQQQILYFFLACIGLGLVISVSFLFVAQKCFKSLNNQNNNQKSGNYLNYINTTNKQEETQICKNT